MAKRSPFKVVVILLAVVMVAAAGLAVWQWENIQALRLYRHHSREDLAAMATELKAEKAQVLASYGQLSAQDLTPEEEAAVISGELSVEKALAIIGGPDTSTGLDVTVSEPTQILDYYLAQIYALKAEFLGRLGALYSQALEDWAALPPGERNEGSKKSFALDYTIQAYNLEGECDARIEHLLAALAADLKSINADTSVIDRIRAAYKEEKSIQKAYYLSLLE